MELLTFLNGLNTDIGLFCIQKVFTIEESHGAACGIVVMPQLDPKATSKELLKFSEMKVVIERLRSPDGLLFTIGYNLDAPAHELAVFTKAVNNVCLTEHVGRPGIYGEDGELFVKHTYVLPLAPDSMSEGSVPVLSVLVNTILRRFTAESLLLTNAMQKLSEGNAKTHSIN